jgi:hypothetical protein
LIHQIQGKLCKKLKDLVNLRPIQQYLIMFYKRKDFRKEEVLLK